MAPGHCPTPVGGWEPGPGGPCCGGQGSTSGCPSASSQVTSNGSSGAIWTTAATRLLPSIGVSPVFRFPDAWAITTDRAVPSASVLSRQLAQCTGAVLERPVEDLLGVRGGLLGKLDGSVRGRIKAKSRKMPKHVLLVDDAVRSGETLKACAAILRERGAEQVWAVVAAAILEPGEGNPVDW
eukprot:gene28088-49877_t